MGGISGYFEIFNPFNITGLLLWEMIAKDPMKLLNCIDRFLSVSEDQVPKKVP